MRRKLELELSASNRSNAQEVIDLRADAEGTSPRTPHPTCSDSLSAGLRAELNARQASASALAARLEVAEEQAADAKRERDEALAELERLRTYMEGFEQRIEALSQGSADSLRHLPSLSPSPRLQMALRLSPV